MCITNWVNQILNFERTSFSQREIKINSKNKSDKKMNKKKRKKKQRTKPNLLSPQPVAPPTLTDIGCGDAALLTLPLPLLPYTSKYPPCTGDDAIVGDPHVRLFGLYRPDGGLIINEE